MCPHTFRIQQTEHAGRCLIANAPLSKGTVLLQSNPPVISVIMREYRREVCAQCYQYDRGRNLSVRDASTGKSFCSSEHQAAWEAEAGHDRKSWEILETYVKRKAGREIEMADAHAPRPSLDAVDRAWDDVRPLAEALRRAREATPAAGQTHSSSKRDAKTMREALDAQHRIVDPDVLSLLLAGVLVRARSGPVAGDDDDGDDRTMASSGVTTGEDGSSPWARLRTLAPTATPYPNPQNLRAHTHAYLVLLALLPLRLLPHLTPETCRAVPTHEVHNSFGLRSLDDAGDEFLGYGVWPEASLFNHSCEPNVAKARGKAGGGFAQARRREAEGDGEERCGVAKVGDGRTWLFWTMRDVAEGGELAISYLGGEEATLDVGERRQRLMSTWGFECRCTKCLREAG